jgi:endoglucanase
VGSEALVGQPLYVDPDNPAAEQARRWRSEGRKADAGAMARLAKRPIALWLTEGDNIAARVRARTQAATRAGRTALLVAYHVPGRDCGSYSAGGSGSPEAYRAWVRDFARGIGSRRATVILEPDAIPQAVVESCLSDASKAERYALLADAVRTFARLPNAAVYIDAGNPGFVRPPARLVAPLRASAIKAADGFALNVSNFFRTGHVIEYGRALSRRLGGAHFVIDTSRNGNGPSFHDDPGGPKWCNPPGRAIGRSPTTRTRRRKVDAYLWVKQPGASDGACRAGAPPAGHWWPEYALALVRN